MGYGLLTECVHESLRNENGGVCMTELECECILFLYYSWPSVD